MFAPVRLFGAGVCQVSKGKPMERFRTVVTGRICFAGHGIGAAVLQESRALGVLVIFGAVYSPSGQISRTAGSMIIKTAAARQRLTLHLPFFPTFYPGFSCMSFQLGWKFFCKHNHPRTIPGGKTLLETVVVFQTAMRIQRDADVVTISSHGFEDGQIIRLVVLHGIRGNGGSNGVETKKGSAAYSSTSFLCGSASRIRTYNPSVNSRMLYH